MATAIRVFVVLGSCLIGFFISIGYASSAVAAEDRPAVPSTSEGRAADPTLPEILSRLREEQFRNHQSVHSYTVIREYQLSSGTPRSSVTAEINFVPPDSKHYAIRSTTGGGSGERVVRRVLDHETQLTSNWKDSLLTDENYEFQYLGRTTLDGRDCFLLAISPLRDSKDLIRGRAWIDASGFNVRRIEGVPGKNPSWWLKRLQLTLEFAPVGDMWLQTAFTARAEVRFFGEHTLTSRDLQYQIPEESASKDVAHPKRRNPAAMVGAGIR